MSLDHTCGNGRATLAERGHDLYETPAVAVESLLREHYAINHHWLRVWEPACGRGAIVRVLRATGRHFVYATDLVDYASPDQDAYGYDFLLENGTPGPIDCILTNPPFKIAAEFVERGLALCPRVILLLRLAFLESERRSSILDNGTLAEVLVYRKRLPMMHRDGWEGRKANSGMAFAWFIFDRHHRGPTTIRRISWDRVEAPMQEAA